MSTYETILYSVENGVATISLNRPKTINAVSQKTRHEWLAALNESVANDEVRVIVISGEGKGLSSGTDLSEGLAGFDTIEDQIQEEYKPIIDAIYASPKLVMASIHGVCAGVTSGIILTCDLAIASEDAFFFFPFAGIGMVPDGGVSYHLVRNLGYKKAMEVFLAAGRVPAKQAEAYGLVNRVVEADALRAATKEWAEELATGAPIAHRLGKECLQLATDGSLSDVIDLEARHQITASTSKDSGLAVQAFLTKQPKPKFTGS